MKKLHSPKREQFFLWIYAFLECDTKRKFDIV